MAPSLRIFRSNAEHGLARLLAQRSSLASRDSSPSPATVSSTPMPATPAPNGVTPLPRGTAAIAGIVAMLCLLVFGFGGWRIWVWRRNKKAASRAKLSEKSNKPELFIHFDDVYDVKRSISSSVVRLTLPTEVKPAMTRERLQDTFNVNLSYQPKVIYSEVYEKTLSPPGITVTPPPLPLQICPLPHYADLSPPVVSPRTFSMRPISVPAILPRLVIVESSYTPSLHDELEIHEGETLRLLEEYEDEWCLVQRVGQPDTEKGVIPRFCVIDKPGVAPSI